MSYYDLSVTGIPVGCPLNEFTEDGQARLDCGVYTEPINQDILQALKSSLDRKDCVMLCHVEDNGQHGDGCCLSVTYDKANIKGETVAIMLPDESLPLLIAALQSVLNMREAEQMSSKISQGKT